jgi:hypothetical protein
MKLTPDQFFAKVHSEGLGYALTDYFSRHDLAEITDVELRTAVLAAHDALVNLEVLIPEEL